MSQLKKFGVIGFVMLACLALNAQADSDDAGATLPYCTAGSQTGAQFWSWTSGSIEQACATAESKLASVGASVDYEYSGYYSSTGLNRASLECNDGRDSVSGYGAEVFSSTLQRVHSIGWSGCVLQITN